MLFSERGELRSKDVENKYVQDSESKLIIVGSDVEALYPSLEAIEVAEIVYQAVLESKVKFDSIDWLEACKYIALTSTAQECKLGPLRRILPRRRHTPGSRPGITGEDPMAQDSGVQDQWEFPTLRNGLTATEKRLVIAKVLKTSILAIFKTHTYSFGGKYFVQVKGGPIGLRSTCCIARLVMLWWDDQLMVALMKLNIKTASGARYMDDVRLFLRGIRLGWRLVNDMLVYKEIWRREEREAGLTLLEKTTEMLKEVMNGICGLLVLTMETEVMVNGTLPILDLQIWVNDANKILYK